MVAIAAVASAFGLYADGLNNQVDFKDTYLDVGHALDLTKDDKGDPAEGDSGRVWFSETSDETGVVAWDDVLGQKVLAVDNSSPLYRTVVGNNGTEMDPQVIDDSGIFFDTTVKFTVGDIETQNLDTGAKLAIWVGADEEAATPYTNLYVTAGSIASETITATNFTAKLPANFDFNAWHRVTVRTIKQAVKGKNVPGFVIFIDGNKNAIECADADYATKIGSFTASDAAAEFLTGKKLFLSLVESDASDALKVSGLGFSGSGSLANVGITDYANAPEFARGAKVFALSWDKGVTGFTANGEVLTGLTDAGTTNLTLALNNNTIAVSGVTYGEGYMNGVWTNGSTDDGVNGTFTWVGGSTENGKIGVKSIAFMVNGKPYATFADALAAALATGEPTTITLAADLAAWDGEVTIDSGDITLDLAGKTIEVADYDDYDLFLVTGGKLTVIDSYGNGAITVAGKAESTYTGIFTANGGTINIGLADGDDKGVTINGKLGGVTNIFKGDFDRDNNDAEDLENRLVDDTYEVVDTVKDGYWTVQKKQEPTTWTVTLKNGEAVVDTQTVADGGFATNVVLDVEGFKGWTNETYTTAFDFEKTQIEADLMLFAWIEAAKKPITPDDDPVELDVDPEASEAEAQAAANKLDFDITDEEKGAGLTKDKVYAKAVRNEADTAWVAVVEIKPEFAPAVKEEASIEVTDVNFGATVKEPVVGLYYGFVAVDALDGETDFAPVGTYQRATSTDPLKLTAPKGEGDARFYKLNASLFDRSVKE